MVVSLALDTASEIGGEKDDNIPQIGEMTRIFTTEWNPPKPLKVSDGDLTPILDIVCLSNMPQDWNSERSDIMNIAMH